MADRAAPPFPTSATPPLVGRGREQAVLRDALAAALAGCGSLVLIGGEAGIGKTALAELVLAEAGARGATVLVGRCYDLSETPPYGPWAEALARAPSGEALPTLPAAVVHAERDGAAAGQDAIVRRVLAYLAALAETRPLVILLEDLHWADPASLDLLRVVGRGVADRALLLLATYRAAEQPPDHPLARLLPALVREARAARLDLGPLDAAAIGALVASRYALADVDRDRLVGFLAGRTEGNALFLGELVRTLEQVGALSRAHDRWALGDLARVPVPALLRQVIAGRLARLGDEDRRLLAVAAVIGQEVPFDVWATVGEAGEGALLDTAERAIAARVLEATQAGVRFAHALIRESLYEGVLAPRRRAWHRRAGEALLATPHPDPDAVASHLRRAGDPRAAEWLRRAGDHARRAYAMQTAAARYGAALGLLEDGMSAERAWLLLRLADVRRFTDVHLALAHLAAAQGAIRLVAEPLLGALCRLLSGRLHCQMGLVERGVRELAAGVALLDALSPEQREQAARAPTHWRHLADGGDDGPGNLMLWQAIAGRYAAARALGGRVRALADIRLAAGAAYATSPGDSCLGLGIACAALGDPAGARRAFREALAHYRAAGNHNMVAGALNTQLQFLTWPYDAEDPPERARLVAALETPVGRAGEAIDAPVAAMMGSTLLLEGRWDELRRAGETPFLWTETGQHHLLAPWAHRLALVGETARAWAAIRQFLPQGAATPPGESFFPVATGLQRLAVALALDADDLPAAREWLGAHDRWLAWSEAVLWQSEGRALWARHHRRAGAPEAARQHAEHALALAVAPRQPLALLAAHRLLGEIDTGEGHHAAAATHLAAALALAEACGTPYERALTLLALAELRAAEGRADEANDHLTIARAILEPLAAAPALERAALATRLDGTHAIALGAPARPDGLSPREIEVLGLLAAGRSNGEIAAMLCLSPATVQRHVANVYLKIGAHNRAEATAYALRQRLA